MRFLRRFKWLGLLSLVPATLLLIALDDAAPLTETWHYILLGVIVVAVCALALRWVERNAELVEREGADALIGYRPLPGTIEAMGAHDAGRSSANLLKRRLVVDYDPTAYPPVANHRPDEESVQ